MQNKPSILSKLLRYALLIIVVSALAIGLIFIGVPKWIVFVLIVFLYLAYTVYLPAHIIYKSKSINTVHKYVKQNYKQPIFSYPFALGNGDDEDVESALHRVIKTYGDEDLYDIYSANLAIHQNDSEKIVEHAAKIGDLDHNHYFHAYGYVLEGRLGEAAEHLEKIHTPWMIHSIKAVVALNRSDKEEFSNEASKSIDSALGMQRYILHHTMRRLKEDI